MGIGRLLWGQYTFTGSDFLFCIVFGIELLAVGFGCLVLTFIGSLMVVLKRAAFHFLYGQCGLCVFQWNGGGFLLTCLVVDILGAGVCEVFAFFLGFHFLWAEPTGS